MGESIDTASALKTVYELQKDAEARAERLRKEADQEMQSAQIWKELQADILKGWSCHVLATLKREAVLAEKVKVKDATVRMALQQIEEQANVQAAATMRRLPKLMEQAAQDKLLLDAECRHPRYTFEKGFFSAEINEQTRIARLADFGGKITDIPADPEAVVAAIQQEKTRVFERNFDAAMFLKSLRKEYLAVLQAIHEQDGESAPIRDIMRNFKKSKKFREDEFIFDLSRLVKLGPHRIEGRTLDFQQTRDAKQGVMLLQENGAGYVGYMVFRKAEA